MNTNNIPVGLATQLGKLGVAAFGVVALVAAVLHGDHSEETITALIGAIATLLTLMGGRYAQAAAALRDAPSLRQSGSNGSLDFPDELEPADDAPAAAQTVPIADPKSIQPDEGDAGASGISPVAEGEEYRG